MGRLTEVRQYLDQDLAETDIDMAGGLVDDPRVISTRYGYDDLGRQTSQTDALGRMTRFTYDAMGRRESRKLPMDQEERFTYYPDGNLKTREDFEGEITIYGYDELGRLTSRAPDSAALGRGALKVNFSYTPNGQRSAQILRNAANQLVWREDYGYDSRGRLDLKETPIGDIDYGYDAAGNLELIQTTRGTEIHYGYDSRNRLDWIDDQTSTAPGVRLTDYTYTPTGTLDIAAFPNDVTVDHNYTKTNRLREIVVTRNGDSLAHFDYSLRPGGHRWKLTERIGVSSTERTSTWSYDEVYRLKREAFAEEALTPVAPEGTVSYSYDKVGNRQSRIVSGYLSGTSGLTSYGEGSHQYDSNDRLETLAGGTSSPSRTFDHDENGNTIGSGSGTDTYDERSRLIRRTEPDGRTITLVYDADGNRVRKTVKAPGGTVVSDVYYLVDTLNPTGYAQVIEELNSNNGVLSLNNRYTYGLDRISQTQQDGTIHYYGYDGLGSVRYLTNTLGAITDRYYYDAYGNKLATLGDNTDNHYLYAGEEWDDDLSLYYNRARYLDPSIGRFWTMDGFEGINRTPQSLHKYLYAHNDPVNGTDPSGFMALMELGTVQVGQNTLRSSKQVVVLGVKKPVLSKLAATMAVNSALLLPLTQDTLDGSDGHAIIGETTTRVKRAKRDFPGAETFSWEEGGPVDLLLNEMGEGRNAALEAANFMWIQSVMNRGLIIWDIGYDMDRVKGRINYEGRPWTAEYEWGEFYKKEIVWTSGYHNKRSVSKPGSNTYNDKLP